METTADPIETTGQDPAALSSALPDFLQRAAFQFGPAIAVWLLLHVPVLADLIPGDATEDTKKLTAFVIGGLVWVATYGWRWATARLSRPPTPSAMLEVNDRIGRWLELAAAGGADGVAADRASGAMFDPNTADGTGAGLADPVAYDPAGDLEP